MAHRHPLTERIPEYLQPYIARQDPSYYIAIDHESWRFILKIAQAFFAQHAHQKYLDGLRETGISTDRIPLISEMDEKLRKFNWRAVPVSGFIPPAVFMEFLSLGVLPIACDMRQLDHLAYTPAPDIVHEAAGHAPIIADPDFSDYLRHYGVVAEKAIYSRQDHNVYEAVRNLSDVKEDPASTDAEIAAAQRRLDDAIVAIDHVSEATQLSRMGWWTFEYGLIGDAKSPKIYGAGLLSSVGESYHCLHEGVKKVPFSMDCVDVNFDITKPQPQLFVAPDFQVLTHALDELARTMSFKRGGKTGLQRAKRAANTCTVELDSGIQMSGVVTEYRIDSRGEPIFVKFDGPAQLAFRGRQIDGQGATYHKQGFSTPIGKLASGELPSALLFEAGKKAMLEFASGIRLEGQFVRKTALDGRTLVLTFGDCTIRFGEEILFKPEWGMFDLACGTEVVSVFGGAADRARYLGDTGGFNQPPGRQKSNLTDRNRALNELYAQVRKLREEKVAPAVLGGALSEIHEQLEARHPDDWLLRYSLLEMNAQNKLNAPWEKSIRARLEKIAQRSPEKAELISRGLALL